MTKRRRHTLREVAERAGVSIGTASRVLSNNPTVSEEMRDAVRRAASELDYELPRRSGQHNGLRTNTAIGVVTRDGSGFSMSNPFYSDVLNGIQRAAAEVGIGLMYETVAERGETAWQLPMMLRPTSVQGIILMGYVSSSFIDRVKASGLPAVLIDHCLPSVELDTVCNDDEEGARLATKHLIEYNHREPPAVIAGPLEHGSLYQRLRGYRRALADSDVKYDESYVRFGNLDAASGYEHTNALLGLAMPPTSIFCFNDLMAIGSLNALHERGLSAPRDLAVVGYDDIELAAHTTPPLTTVHVDKGLLGMQAFWHLVERLKHPGIAYRETRVPVSLVERATTRARYQQRTRSLTAAT